MGDRKFSVPEVAQITNVSVGALRQQFARGLIFLDDENDVGAGDNRRPREVSEETAFRIFVANRLSDFCISIDRGFTLAFQFGAFGDIAVNAGELSSARGPDGFYPEGLTCFVVDPYTRADLVNIKSVADLQTQIYGQPGTIILDAKSLKDEFKRRIEEFDQALRA